MKYHKVCFLVNIVTLISSGMCVIFVIYFIIAPQIKLQVPATSVCRITQLRMAKMPHRGVPATFVGLDRGLSYTAEMDTNNVDECVEAKATFVNYYGEIIIGYLQLRRYDDEDIHTMTSKVICALCSDLSVQLLAPSQ